MNYPALLSSFFIFASAVSVNAAQRTYIAQSPSCFYYTGDSATGKGITVDLCSIAPINVRAINFTYYLGNELVSSQANCTVGTWTTFPERQVYQPQSAATQTMVGAVCRRSGFAEIAVVYAPPSNVRDSPNGEILCTLEERGNLSVYGSTANWYYTDACGVFGVIHSSQIRF